MCGGDAEPARHVRRQQARRESAPKSEYGKRRDPRADRFVDLVLIADRMVPRNALGQPGTNAEVEQPVIPAEADGDAPDAVSLDAERAKDERRQGKRHDNLDGEANPVAGNTA